ncbi:sulfatase family protein [Rubritalea marina]|uniref:sulfatase family protein n=1 Tax=Rubritalea marina TaxID=361055 RepID=UPI0003825279|nr:arylsulfatase [Rubritalea marina]
MNRFTRFLAALCISSATLQAASKPNIVYILTDDQGYGDVSLLNPERGKIPTPAMDRIGKEGMIFTDAHSGSSVCTPTRYGILTGRYSWRSTLQSGVVQGFAPCLISEDRPTVAKFLQQHGYDTAIVGKWHLNFQYTDPSTGKTLKRIKRKALAPVGSKIPDGPVHRGFNYFHGFHHAGDMEGVIENDTVIAHDPVINMLPRVTNKAVRYIENHAKKDQAKPFFLYVPYGSPHTPIVPTPEWQKKSGISPYADFVMQTDAGVGEILDALDRCGLTDNTLVIFTADNGCSKAAQFSRLENKGHFPSAHLRGSKSDLWEGGHRVPFLVRWPAKIKPGTHSDQLICHTDLFASCADLLGAQLPDNAAEDSVSIIPAFSGKPIKSSRKGVIHHSISGHFAYREGKWKLLLARGSGGWTAPKETDAKKTEAPVAQLYNLENDPGETTNLYTTHPELVARLLAQLESDVAMGRSTKGPQAQNDLQEIKLWKSGK